MFKLSHRRTLSDRGLEVHFFFVSNSLIFPGLVYQNVIPKHWGQLQKYKNLNITVLFFAKIEAAELMTRGD